MKHSISFIFLICLAGLFSACNTVPDGLVPSDEVERWTSYTKNNSGLIGDLVTTVYTDTKGNIWIGTTSGISKFDGESFTNYSTTIGPLTNNWILSILEDRDDNILVGTKDGLNLFDGTDWFFFPSMDDVEIYALVESDNGDVWAGTEGYGVVRLFYSGGFAQYFDSSCGNCNFVNSLHKNQDGTIWAGTEADLKLFSNTTTSSPTYQSFDTSDGLASNWVEAIGEDIWGNIWFGGFGEFFITRYRDNDFEAVLLGDYDGFNWVRAFQVDSHGKLWIASDISGLIYFDGAAMRKEYKTLTGAYITALTIDMNGTMWVGTEGEGLATFTPGIPD